MTVKTIRDTFDRVDSATLGAPWVELVGDAYLKGQRAHLRGGPPGNNLMVVADSGTGDVDVSVDIGGDGDCLYFRVTDRFNWWRLRNYSWEGGSDPSTRVYRVFIDRCRGGHITQMTYSLLTATTRTRKATQLRVKCAGQTILAYSDLELNLTVPFARIVDPFNASATKHGIGTGRAAADRGQADVVSAAGFDSYVALPLNSPPNAPPLFFPTGGTVVDRARSTRYSWGFSDADDGDTQSRADLRWREVGTTAWTTKVVKGPLMYLDVDAGTIPIGDHEWQVRSYDSHGLIGPWSRSGFFSVGATPTDVVLVSPINGATLHDSQVTAMWVAPVQDGYEVQVVAADAAGAPDEHAVRWSRSATDRQARSVEVPFPMTGRTEFVQVRVQAQGLWSAWDTARVQVTLEPPLRPRLLIDEDRPVGAITLTPQHFTPREGSAPVGSVNLYRRDVVGGGNEQLLAAALQPFEPFTDWRVRSGVAYEYLVEAVGVNGAYARSEWLAQTLSTDLSTVPVDTPPGTVSATVTVTV